MTGRPAALQPWIFLGVLLRPVSVSPDLVVAELTLPQGASPPLHRHDDLDDSFYVLQGRMVTRCGDETSMVSDGDWVPFPKGIPHTFRVLDGPLRALLVHRDDSFLRFVQAVGRPAQASDAAHVDTGLSAEELDRLSLANGITNIGPPMEAAEAAALVGQLTGAAAPR